MKRTHHARSDQSSAQEARGRAEPEDTDTEAEKKAKSRSVTCSLINLVGIMERMDEQVLPAASSNVACAFKIGPAGLGSITFTRAVVQALASPFGGLGGFYFDRVLVVALGCLIWGTGTMLFAFSKNVEMGRIVMGFNGVGLSLIIPNSQSLIADYYAAGERGAAFGLLQLTGAFGGMFGALYATNIGGMHVLGMEGWRFAFFSEAIISWCVGLATLLFATDPRRSKARVPRIKTKHTDVSEESQPLLGPDRDDGSPQQLEGDNSQVIKFGSKEAFPGPSGYSSTTQDEVRAGQLLVNEAHHSPVAAAPKGAMWPRILDMLRTPTFLIIILQGVLGTMPWNGMVFFTLYFQLLGMGNLGASILLSLLLAGTALGGLLGGWIGDRAAARYPLSGRIAVTQLSVAAGIPLSFLLMWGLPHDVGSPLTVALHGVVMFTFGLLISWAAPACNNPIFAEIVPEDMRNLVYSFDRSFEGALAAMSAWLVGWTAEHWFGFHGDATPSGCEGGGGSSPSADLEKAASLGEAMLMFMVVPWSLCLVVYCGLYWTYPRDRAKVVDAAAALPQFSSKVS